MDFLIVCIVVLVLSCMVWKNWSIKPKQKTFKQLEKERLHKYYL